MSNGKRYLIFRLFKSVSELKSYINSMNHLDNRHVCERSRKQKLLINILTIKYQVI